MQHIAMEGRCFVVSANQFHGPGDYPPDYPPANTDGGEAKLPDVWSRGGSCIVSPLGEVLAGPLWDKEGIIYADVGGVGCANGRLTLLRLTVQSWISTQWDTTAARRCSWGC